MKLRFSVVFSLAFALSCLFINCSSDSTPEEIIEMPDSSNDENEESPTDDGNTGDENSGDGSSGDGNSGDGNTGDENSGDGGSGDENSGDGNTGGDENSGDGNTGGDENPDSTADDVIITVETESVELVEDWQLKTTIEGYTGEGYIVWEGQHQTWRGNPGGVGNLEYTINIETPGTYLFKWKSHIAKNAAVDPWAEHNDSWLKFPDATDFFAKKENSILYPKGSGKTPNPRGENGNGFFKVYMNTVNEWQENVASTSDNDAHEIFVSFETAGEYTVIIAPRSDFHAIDSFRLILQNE